MLRASRREVWKTLTAGPFARLFAVDPSVAFDAELADLTLTAAHELVDAPPPPVRVANGLSPEDAAIANAILSGIADRRAIVREIAEAVIGGAHDGPREWDIYSAGKTVETPTGRVELRALLRPVPPTSSASAAVRELIRSLIAAEDPAHPLGDDELVAALAEHGYQLKWTADEPHPIASYRRVLGIADAVSRRRDT